MPDLSLERALSQRVSGPIAGVDEVGRGPWAGPVIACAVVLPDLSDDCAGLPRPLFSRIDDSKVLKPGPRDELADNLSTLLEHSYGAASVSEIDGMNILQASFLAMRRALAGLRNKPAGCLVDGNRDPVLLCPTELVVKGDGKSITIAAASILAKTHRDRMMRDLAIDHPGYGWERNMGYGTKQHQEALKRYGVTEHHRRSFAPIRQRMAETTRP